MHSESLWFWQHTTPASSSCKLFCCQWELFQMQCKTTLSMCFFPVKILFFFFFSKLFLKNLSSQAFNCSDQTALFFFRPITPSHHDDYDDLDDDWRCWWQYWRRCNDPFCHPTSQSQYWSFPNMKHRAARWTPNMMMTILMIVKMIMMTIMIMMMVTMILSAVPRSLPGELEHALRTGQWPGELHLPLQVRDALPSQIICFF